MNPVAGQSADFNQVARAIAAMRLQKLQNQVADSPVGQTAQGYLSDFQPTNPNEFFQAGQALANGPTPAALPAKGFLALASAFNPRKSAMLAEDVKELLPIIRRFMTSKNDINYGINKLPQDESVLRQVAGAYIDDKFAAKDPLENVAQELLNRINVDRMKPVKK